MNRDALTFYHSVRNMVVPPVTARYQFHCLVPRAPNAHATLLRCGTASRPTNSWFSRHTRGTDRYRSRATLPGPCARAHCAFLRDITCRVQVGYFAFSPQRQHRPITWHLTPTAGWFFIPPLAAPHIPDTYLHHYHATPLQPHTPALLRAATLPKACWHPAPIPTGHSSITIPHIGFPLVLLRSPIVVYPTLPHIPHSARPFSHSTWVLRSVPVSMVTRIPCRTLPRCHTHTTRRYRYTHCPSRYPPGLPAVVGLVP